MGMQRFSQQRERICRMVSDSTAHPTAQEVYDALKPDMPRLSLGTVYRNLHQLALDGRVREIDGPQARFDGNTKPHTHFRCVCCGGVSDLWDLCYEAALDVAAQKDGRVVLGHDLMFTGYCSACAEKNKESQNI